MKKLILILLTIILCMSIFITVSAEINFVGWDKWDQQLPPENNKSWHWTWPSKKPGEYIIKSSGIVGDDLIILSSDLYYGKRLNMKAVSVCLYSYGDIRGNDLDWYISNADIALAVFPPKKGRIIIISYKKKDDILKFFEEWEIKYQVSKIIETEIVVPLQSKFREEFKKWLESISSLDSEDINKNLLNFILPKILVADDKFIISVSKVYIKE